MQSVNFIAQNDVQLLQCGTDYFPALIAAIDAAEYDVYFETYIFAGDDTGALVQQALERAAGRGVVVCVITDWFGTGNARSKRMHAELLAAGVHHRSFNPWFRRGVTRTHRKICVVDRSVALVGGININVDMFCDYDHRSALSAPPPMWPTSSRVSSQGMAGWSQATNASRWPLGSRRGQATKSLSPYSTRPSSSGRSRSSSAAACYRSRSSSVLRCSSFSAATRRRASA